MELLCAVVLMSIALMAVMTATCTARNTQQLALYISIGRNIAQSKIEALRATSINSITSQAGSSTSSALPNGNSIQVTVSGYPNSSITDLYLADVTVKWPEGNGTRKISYETLIVRQ